jgi:hypothetical protein
MARRTSVPSAPQHAQLTSETMRTGIRRLGQCIERVEAFDPAASISKGDDLIAVASAMTAAVESALGQTFGNGTVEYWRYADATNFELADQLYAPNAGSRDRRESSKLQNEFVGLAPASSFLLGGRA